MPDLNLEFAKVATAAIERLGERLSGLEQRDAMRAVARQALRDAGHKGPTDAEVEDVVDTFLHRRYTAARRKEAEPASAPPPGFDWTKGVTAYIGDKAIVFPAHKAADATTHDPARRLEAHAKHLRNLDERVKKVERKAP